MDASLVLSEYIYEHKMPRKKKVKQMDLMCEERNLADFNFEALCQVFDNYGEQKPKD